MFEYLIGTLIEANPQKLTLEVGGIGYGVYISLSTFEKLPQMGAKVKIFTSLVVREDSQRMYGFIHSEEKNLFETLNEISGIGPRLSLAILGHMSLDDLHLAVEHTNTKAISKIPGIGKKMAEKLIIELRDKFEKSAKQKLSPSHPKPQGVVTDAISALINLGFNPLDAQKAVKQALPSSEKEPTLSELISLALKSK